MRWLLLVTCLVAPGALAQAFDASLPDASVGESGADRASEEGDTANAPCLSDRDCDRGLSCRSGSCTWQRFRDADYTGCSAAGAVWVPALALALFWARHRFVKVTK